MKKTLCVVAYRFNIEGLLELDAEAPAFYQVRPVAQTALIFAVLAHREFPFVVRHFLYVHNSKITLVQFNICTKN